jgi:hypothetical protein
MTFPGLRKIPYPYKAALALANDIDNTPSLTVFLEMLKFLNATTQTVFGTGLGLEIGSSFWFFNATQSNQLSYFKNLTREETIFAPVCRELWNSGHLDCLHTYGNFDEGGFERKFAEMAIDELTKHSAEIQTWINHGNSNNFQNLGVPGTCYGDQPGHPAYHFDLLNHLKMRFVWTGKMTHVLGQNAANTVNVRLKILLQKMLADSKYRSLKSKPFFLENDLIQTMQMRDGHLVWEFQRFVNNWGRQTVLDSNDLAIQLKPANIWQLIANEGISIVYTHMCEGLSIDNPLPAKLYRALQFIAEKNQGDELLVTTTSRLLKYTELVHTLKWTCSKKDNYLQISIDPELSNLDNRNILTGNDLQGLTFYCDRPENVQIFLGDQALHTAVNGRDYTGRYSVSVPWQKLEFPDI